MKITFIDHSGFMAQTENTVLLFDYYKGALPEELPKPLYIFASHRHGDHYVPEIFDYGEKFAGTRYVLDSGITVPYDLGEDVRARITFVQPHEDVQVGDVRVRTLCSTDEGVAFLVDVDGKRLYHAGDLHLWLWGEHDTPAEAAAMTEAFQHEVRRFAGIPIDVAFLPLDPRQSAAQSPLGLDFYARTLTIGHIFPMHLWGRYSLIEAFKHLPIAADYCNKIHTIHKEGDTYEI